MRDLARELNFRLLDVSFLGQGLSRTTTELPNRPQDYAATVLGYLKNKYAAQPKLLTELETRTLELMREVNNALTTD